MVELQEHSLSGTVDPCDCRETVTVVRGAAAGGSSTDPPHAPNRTIEGRELRDPVDQHIVAHVVRTFINMQRSYLLEMTQWVRRWAIYTN